MYNYGIIICLKDSINSETIKNRTKNLIHNLNIQFEIKHSISSTIGCFTSHIKALNCVIDILSKNKYIDYVIIGEEDITIDYNSKDYKNLLQCLKEYNKYSDYILHLGGFPVFTNNLYDIFKNHYDKIKLKSRIYLTTGYVINLKTANKLLETLNNSSNHIHCDAIFSHSGIDQYLVKGNIVNQLEIFNSDNTYINNLFSTKTQTNIFVAINKVSIFFISNNYTFLLLSLIAIYKNNYLVILSEFFIQLSKFISKKIVHKEYNKYLSKNIFTYLEIVSLARIYTILKLL
jgi:GR25 family glycosyltransferase involved in LPS biosynthesis